MFTTKKKIAIVALLMLAIMLVLGKNYISEVVKSPSIRIHLINIAKVAIPLKNLILMRNIDDKIALLKSSGSCVFCDLSNGNFKGSDLKGVDLRYANLSGADLSNTNLSGVDLNNLTMKLLGQRDTTLQDANLSGANLDGVDLSYKDLTGVNLTGVDLRNKNLSGVNLSGVDLRNNDLTGTLLTSANLSGVNLDGVDLSNTDLSGTILKDARKIEISLINPSNSIWPPALNEVQNLTITRYDLTEDAQYLATKEGFLFESINNELKLVLDLNKKSLFPFINDKQETGFVGLTSKNELIYVAYSSRDNNGLHSLVVDEYSMNFTKVRNIIKLEGFENAHFGGSLDFDSFGRLYISVGDGWISPDAAQNLNDYRGKILRLDVSDSKIKPEIIAYGMRNPWGMTIDSKDRMFILQCGWTSVEALYLVNDLYSGIPANFGWPVFEGSKRITKDPLKFNDISTPIFETSFRPGCLTAGVYLDDLESFLFGDFWGTIRLLKQKENGDWYVLHEYKQDKNLWGFGLDEKTKKIFVAPNYLELEILVDQVKLR